MNQLALEYGARWLTDQQWAALLDVARAVVGDLGLKQVAFDLDVAASSISNALAQRDRHAFRGEWLVYLTIKDPHRRIIHKLAEIGGGEFRVRPELTPAEKLERLDIALAQLGPEISSLVRRKAGL
jgi:hypothetical protein